MNIFDHEEISLERFSDLGFANEFFDYFALGRAFRHSVKDEKTPYSSSRIEAVRDSQGDAWAADLRDLARLYWVVRNRKMASVVELGSGYSTGVIGLALSDNAKEFGSEVARNRRIQNPFTVRVIEESSHWAEVTAQRLAPGIRDFVHIDVAPFEVISWQGRYCTVFKIPKLLPADLFLIDGPSQYGGVASESGWNTDDPVLMPMSADSLPIEHFFEPGALIKLEGRTANARFLQSNFQRNWVYRQLRDSDINIFELQESALGELNQRRLDHIGGWLIPE